EKFQAVYTHEPSGSWAPAGLYMAGKLYEELYKRSYLDLDKKEALDIFERIIKRFPRSQYRKKAEQEIRNLSRKGQTGTASTKARHEDKKKGAEASVSGARDKFVSAENCYNRLKKNPKHQKYRDKWFSCIDKFQAVYQHDPSGPWAAAGLYYTAVLYQEMYKHSFKAADIKTAHGLYEQIVRDFPTSQYRDKAFEKRHASSKTDTRISLPEEISVDDTEEKAVLDSIAREIEKLSSAQTQAEKKSDRYREGGATVEGLRFWSNPSYTRVVIDIDNETTYAHRLLKKDPSIKKPQRLYIDLNNSRLGKDIRKVIPINDNLLSDARAGQYTSDSVRVVVDIKSFKTYKIFSLKNPFRIVVDVWGKTTAATRPATRMDKKTAKVPAGALAKQLALGVSRIIIDPGHGGRDYGAPGYLKGVHEKNIVLQISKRLARRIREDLGVEVILTRNSDRNLTLEERTAIANTKNADLFISVHTNAAKDRRAYGIETFFLNLATDEDAILVAARENATSTKNISDLQTILSDLMQNAKINESSRLAAQVQKSLFKDMRKKYTRIKNKGVKQAPFYVLLGAQMPAILIETSFISNSRECKRLTSATYQEQLSIAIVNGIRSYLKEINPTALIKSDPKHGA
ncbi:MAG: N-acetylmuramoyl-L-alanine amidase, partial [Deltaproteobacteria bacterium]|nr:N-acetylmuramoyl-L-alanine amidase [Deltaproteobacteria bacterium]